MSTTQQAVIRFRTSKNSGSKRDPVTITAPAVSWEDISNFSEKEKELLVEVANECILSYIRPLYEEGGVPTQAQIDEITWTYISNIPPRERKSRDTISKEQWEAFYASYAKVLLASGAKTEKQVENHLFAYKKRFKLVSPNLIQTIKVLMGQLAFYLEKAGEEGEFHTSCVEFLIAAGEKIINPPEVSADLLDNI